MTLLFHFQGPELMQADRHPGSEIAYPVVVLQSAVGRLLALPVEVSYTLPEMLQRWAARSTTRRKDYFHFPLGHGLRAEALHAAWYGGKADNLDEIRQQARLYLFAVQSLLRAVRERAAAAPVRLAAEVRPAERHRHPRSHSCRAWRSSPATKAC